MKGEKIKPIPHFKKFFDYFVRRAKRVLRLKDQDFKSIHIDLYDDCPITGDIVVWFHDKKGIVAKASFNSDGTNVDKQDYRQ